MAGGVWLVLDLDAKKRGSMEQQLIALGRRLRREGVPTTMVFSAPPADFPGRELRKAGVELRDLDYRRPDAPGALARWLASERPELVHFHFVSPYSRHVAVAKLAGARVLVHDHLSLTAGSALRAAAKRVRGTLLNRFVDLRVAVSSYAAETLVRAHGVPRERVAVVENGIDLERFRCGDGAALRLELGIRHRPLFACVTRLDQEKGGETLVRALPDVGRGAHAAFVGEGPRLGEWKALARFLGVEDRLHFLGLRNDVEEVMAAATAAVLTPEYEEAFGLAAVEGMASSRPVVVSRSGALPEVVGPGGLVVPKRDPAALAAALNRLIVDDTLARRLGREARRRAEERYGMDRYVERMVKLYRRFLRAPHRRAA